MFCHSAPTELAGSREFGGLLSEGYLHGLNHHYEAVLQLRGEAANRQIAGAELALVTAGAGPYGCAIVYGSGRP